MYALSPTILMGFRGSATIKCNLSSSFYVCHYDTYVNSDLFIIHHNVSINTFPFTTIGDPPIIGKLLLLHMTK